jgi:phospholipid/cholesterol/gamma-HCH transport system ATP-binding protein
MPDQLITCRDLSCEFSLFLSLRSLCFSLSTGENAVIFGSENSGTDLICSVLTGMQSFTGEILYRNRSIRDLPDEERNRMRREVVYMQRSYGLISNMTVEENIALPLRYHSPLSSSQIDELVDSIITDLNLDYCRDMRPIHLKPSEILNASYGRAIALDPPLLLIEHPLEGQCLINTMTFLKNLLARCSDPGRSVVIVTYEPLRFLDFAQRFIMLDYGKIVFDGDRRAMENPDNEFARQFLGFSGDGPMQIL